jgi:hypothetical protein
MKSFSQFNELKRPTIVSAPIKGPNQDQSGESPSHSTADYTISDEKKKNENNLPVVSKAGPRDGLTRAGLAIASIKDKIKSSMRKEEIELDEAKRGRPPKNKSESDPGSDNIIMQLRKVITLRGQNPVTFVDGRKAAVSPSTAHRLLTYYDNLRTTGEKHSFAARIHKSAESMRDVIAGKKEIVKPKISLGGYSYKGK